MTKLLKDTLIKFEGKKLLVIGDVMLDKTTKGTVRRISPEAPVPVLDIEEETYSPGGAANIAANAAKLGAKVNLCGIIGNDEDGVILMNTLQSFGIETDCIVKDTQTTIKKERVISGKQHIVRIDTEPENSASEHTKNNLLQKLQKHIQNANAVAVGDYRKGTISKELAEYITKKCLEHKIPLIVDTKPEHTHWFSGATILTLNQNESLIAFGAKNNENIEMDFVAKELSKKIGSSILISRGAKESILCENETIHHIPVPHALLIDKSGSGDTLTATIALSLAGGASLKTAAQIGNHAASIVIGKSGVSTITINEVLALLRHEISKDLQENMLVKQSVIDTQLDKIEKLANHIVDVYRNHKKILIFGNGGSAADAQHFAAELVGRYKMERRGLPAIALTTDTSAITAIGNDYSFEQIFSRQVEALANQGDLVVGITTSGSSPNVLLAMQKAKEIGATTVGLTGKDGGKLKDAADLCIIVPSNNTPRIQETHITIIHIVCELLEKEMEEEWKEVKQ